MSAGDLCYKKGGSALAYSKITANNGALIFKSGEASGFYFVLEFGTSSVKWVYSKSGTKPCPMYEAAVNCWTNVQSAFAWAEQSTAVYKSDIVSDAGAYQVEHSVNFTLSTDTQVGTHDGYRGNFIVDTTFSYTVKSYNAQTNVLVHEASISRYVDKTGSTAWNVGDTVNCVLNPLVITMAADGTFTLSF